MIKMHHTLSILLINFLFAFSTDKSELHSPVKSNFKLGNEVLLEQHSEHLNDQNIGLVINNSSVLSDGTYFMDALLKKFPVKKIFSPEHGLLGNDFTGDYTDEESGTKVISLYGDKKKPDRKDLSDIDVLVYDIQDAGARFYTYINTMFYCMESCLENDREIIICDRPIIQNGNYTDGFMLDENQHSFVGMIDIPVVYGMTCGELAAFINGEYFDGKCKVTIMKMQDYSHDTEYESLNLNWVKPSPNLYYPSSAVAYTGTCLFEGTNYSEGRGSDRPFEYTGAPYCDGDLLASELNKFGLKGVNFRSINFIPTKITSPSNPPKYVGEKCSGVFVDVTDKKLFEPFKAGVAMLYALNKNFPEFEFKKNRFIDKLAGTSSLRQMIINGNTPEEIYASYETELKSFRIKRDKYLLY